MIALDLFAGTGWGVACQRLGIQEYGVENMPEAVAVRAANGMHTAYRDVWEGLLGEERPRLLTDAERAERQRVLAKSPQEWDDYDLLIASPPCQTFSMAGAGAGRKALDEVLAAIDQRLYLDPEALGWGMTERPMVTADNAIGRAEGIGGSGGKAAVQREKDRGAWIGNQKPNGADYQSRDADYPTPTVTGQSLSARIMRSNYGTGGDAAARGEGVDAQPAPTITSKADRNKWVGDGRPAPTVTGGGATTGGAEVFGRHGRAIIERMVGDGPRETPHLDPEKPSTTVAGDPRLTSRDHHEPGAQAGRSTRVTVAEAAALQSYPADFIWAAEVEDPRKPGQVKPITKTNTFLQIGNAVPPLLAEAILREVLS